MCFFRELLGSRYSGELSSDDEVESDMKIIRSDVNQANFPRRYSNVLRVLDRKATGTVIVSHVKTSSNSQQTIPGSVDCAKTILICLISRTMTVILIISKMNRKLKELKY